MQQYRCCCIESNFLSIVAIFFSFNLKHTAWVRVAFNSVFLFYLFSLGLHACGLFHWNIGMWQTELTSSRFCNKVKVCQCCLHCLLFVCCVQWWIPLHGAQFNLESFGCNHHHHHPSSRFDWILLLSFKIRCTFPKYKYNLNCSESMCDFAIVFLSFHV